MSASRRSQVPAFEVMAILDRIAALRAEGRDIVSLCAGEPSGGATTDVRVAAARLVQGSDPLGYTPPLGDLDLRREITDHVRRWYGIDVEPRSVALTTGASGAFVLAFLAAFDAGDRVAVIRPGYPAYRNLLAALDLEVIEVAVGPATGFQPTIDLLDEAVERNGPLKGLVLASPANPTGSMVTRGQLAELAGWCRARDVRLISDEIYHGVTYPRLAPEPAPRSDPESTKLAADGVTSGIEVDEALAGEDEIGVDPEIDVDVAPDRGTCAWELDRSTIVVSSFSKYWGMTGWRLGWALLPDDLVEAVDALAGNVALCPPTLAQRAALGAFTDASYAEADARVAAMARARCLLFDSLDRLGWGPVAPADGAFYLWADITPVLGAHDGSPEWCRGLLEEAGVAVVPGTDMDAVDGHRSIRLSFAAGEEAVAEAVERIAAWQQPSFHRPSSSRKNATCARPQRSERT